MAKKKRRRYSDDERSSALAALTANGGNLTRTAKQLGIPKATLEGWSKGTSHPEASEGSDAKKTDLASMFKGFVDRVLRLTTDEDIRGANLKDRMTAAGIAVDKAQLLEGKPTEIAKTDGTVTTRIDRFASAFEAEADRQGEGDPPGDGTRQQVDTV